MNSHSLVADVTCPKCRATARRTYGAKPISGSVKLAISTRCETCGFAQEYDGDGLTDEARSSFIARDGKWSLVVRASGPNPNAVVAILRKRLETTLPLAVQMLRATSPLATGARVEVEAVAQALAIAGAEVELVPATQ